MYIIGLDLGQAQDYTALVLIDKQTDIQIKSIKRFPKGTPYTDISDDVNTIIQYRLGNKCDLVVDYTGVGRAVVDQLRQRKLNPIPVSITSGNSMRFVHDSQSYNVPKNDIIAELTTLFERHLIKIPDGMIDNIDGQEVNYTKLIEDEVLNFQKQTTVNNHEIFNARQGTHDDIVLALGIACWYSNLTKPQSTLNPFDFAVGSNFKWER